MTTVIQGLAEDQDYRDFTIAKVERDRDGWFSVTLNDGWCIGVGPDATVKPKPGKTIRLYGRGMGYPVRGIAIDGVVVRYQTEAEYRDEAKRTAAVERAARFAEFETRRADVEARIAALPANFRARFERFMAGNPDFLPEFGDYELMCCEQAVIFADRMSADELRRWAKLPHDGQKAMVPEMSDGHSGNTFGASVRLAILSHERPDWVALEHGALAVLVGCEAYGCTHGHAMEAP